jgi:glutamate-1-semialdehyde aminotransferase/predicted aldo/keto reductase-like oxidoreductase
MMRYRRLGRTNLQVSVVGFGTCQLRLVPESQALATLRRGFELGVNLVHTAPDYEGADDLIARAVREAGRPVIVCSQGYGPMSHFEHLFESAAAKFGRGQLELFGIACVDDREALGENVWGSGGMIDFLKRQKARGRLGGIFCTTHGTPEYLRKLIESDAFDALMVAYNPLGFHLLSYHPGNGRPAEELARTRDEVFPLARQRDVGLLIMKPLAGGLLCAGKAFPPRARLTPPEARVTAAEVLRLILAHPEVSCVVPGTASPAEAEENARAGHEPAALPAEQLQEVRSRVRLLDTALCSRCGACDALCSQKLPVSWLFRAGYVSVFPSATFETPAEFEYFRLHPGREATCATCTDVTCACPAEIPIPTSLTRIHDLMGDLRERGLVPPPPAAPPGPVGGATWAAQVVIQDIPAEWGPGQTEVCRLYLENTGQHPWHARSSADRPRTVLCAFWDGTLYRQVPLRDDVPAGGRGHFVFELAAPAKPGVHELRLDLAEDGPPSCRRQTLSLVHRSVRVSERTKAVAANGTPVPPEYGVGYLHHNLPRRGPADSLQAFWVTLENRGGKVWRRHPPGGQAVDLAVYLDGAHHATVPLPREEVRPGERVTLHAILRLPREVGPHRFQFDLVEQNVTRFEQQGAPPLVVPVETTRQPPPASSRVMDRAYDTNSWFFLPSGGVYRTGEDRPYPLFARKARGCRITDLEGNRYVDYVMGWGCALLGYAPRRVQRAVARCLGSGAVLTLPHHLEMEVTEALCRAIPCAEMVLFGKNGSDVCTAAVRLARVHTGKPKVLVCGYHGWQDWHVERDGFGTTGVPERTDQLVFPFPFNDLGKLAELMDAHRGQVAAVMLEPAGPVEGPNGPLRDADAVFLRGATELARREGALLIFDEIITGFRYPLGSVQRATGVVPDLACFGKALSAGMPLSALVGRREIFRASIGKIYYGPTYKGEVYSFAAAREALAVYQEKDVPRYVWDYGMRLKEAVNRLGRQLEAPAELIGPPFRMVVSFTEPDEQRAVLMRTLVQQELVKRGILTYKCFLLPSYAHDARALAQTVRAFEHALGLLAEAAKKDAFARYLEIPPVT